MPRFEGNLAPLFVRGLTVFYAAFEPFPNPKGSGTRISELSRGLAEAGAHVVLVTLPGRGSGALPRGVTHRPLAIPEPNFLRRAMAFRGRVARELEAVRPDVVHVRGVFEGDAALAHAAARRIPFVFEVNGLPSIELVYHHRAVADAHDFQAKLRKLEERLIRGATLVVTQSRTTREFLTGRGLEPEAACAVIPNGADPSAFPEPGGATSGKPVELFYAGTLAPWQGAAELLMAVRRCRRQHARDVRLTLAGPVRRRWQRSLERRLRRLGVGEAVHLAGALEREELARRIAASDVCLAPLRKDARNGTQGSSPIKLFEYMAAGRALVSTDLPCVREIVAHGETGLLTSSSRPAALAEAILALADDPALRSDLGRRARRRIAESATWTHRREALSAAYAELLRARA